MPCPFATSTSSESPDSDADLNLPNRRMRTRMSGGVGGEGRAYRPPLSRCAPSMGKTLEVQVLLEVGHNDQSEAQGRNREVPSGGSVERNRGSTYRNRIGGAGIRGERS